YPWLVMYDPLRPRGELVCAVPPSGHVAGVIARTDSTAGVHVAPANAEVRSAVGATADVDSVIQSVLNPLHVNCIRTLAGYGLRVYGARTLSSDPSWRYVNVRRLLLMVEEAVREGSAWATFEPN